MMKLSMKHRIPHFEGNLKNEMNIDKMFYELAKQCVDELFEIEE